MLDRQKVSVKPYRPLRVKWDHTLGLMHCIGGSENIPPKFPVTVGALIVGAAQRGGMYARSC